ncbi:MAG TPA: F0F1 ATP synthase subunit B [Hyphomicrobiaceae bacterium]|nr:F0F1 ATP synthase subunit B [Hyphomicrobiaceae bacterium]
MLAWLTVALAAVPDTVEKKSGLPQLNLPDFAPQLFWLALTFGILYFILARFTLPRIGSVIEERENRIQRDLDEAERLKSETESALAAYEQALADARARANALARDTREKLAAEVEQERTKVEAGLAAKLAEAETRIGTMKASALAEVGSIARDTVADVVKKLIGSDVTPDEIRAAMQPGAGE